MKKRTSKGADLLSGSGGASQDMPLAGNRLQADLELIAVNHWQVAIDTHILNHPEAVVKQIGNAVPPPMAATLRAAVLA